MGKKPEGVFCGDKKLLFKVMLMMPYALLRYAVDERRTRKARR